MLGFGIFGRNLFDEVVLGGFECGFPIRFESFVFLDMRRKYLVLGEVVLDIHVAKEKEWLG